MRKIFTLIAAVLFTASVFAQSPQKMSYQAVIRNSSNVLVTNTQIGMEINIHQGSPTGTIVYTETQTPTTNANGLVSIEIGGGAGFNTIDWSAGPYFLETKTDIAGGTNYTITGTTQLLSVPYALHAKTAETVTGGITETDPVFGASPANSITSVDISNWNNKLNTEVDGSVTNELQTLSISNDTVYLSNGGFVKLPAGFDGQYSSLTGTPTNVSAFTNDAGYLTAEIDPTVTKYSVGDFAQGGIVFWVDETGQHGLVCAKVDQSTGVRWYAGTYGNTQAKGDGPFSGEANTSIIIAAQVAIGDDGSTYAARICNELQVTEGVKTYGDWYLPSKEELNLMYQNKATINATAMANGGSGFASADYWSSTENYNNNAWKLYFGNGSQYLNNKYGSYRVRAVRAF